MQGRFLVECCMAHSKVKTIRYHVNRGNLKTTDAITQLAELGCEYELERARLKDPNSARAKRLLNMKDDAAKTCIDYASAIAQTQRIF